MMRSIWRIQSGEIECERRDETRRDEKIARMGSASGISQIPLAQAHPGEGERRNTVVHKKSCRCEERRESMSASHLFMRYLLIEVQVGDDDLASRLLPREESDFEGSLDFPNVLSEVSLTLQTPVEAS